MMLRRWRPVFYLHPDPPLQNRKYADSCTLKALKTWKLIQFYSQILPPWLAAHSVCFISRCPLRKCLNAEHKNEHTLKKKKTLPVLHSNQVICHFYNPFSISPSKSNLAHVSVFTSFPSFTALPPRLFFFLLTSYPFLPPLCSPVVHLLFWLFSSVIPPAFVLLPFHSSPLPLPPVPPSISQWQHERLPVR